MSLITAISSMASPTSLSPQFTNILLSLLSTKMLSLAVVPVLAYPSQYELSSASAYMLLPGCSELAVLARSLLVNANTAGAVEQLTLFGAAQRLCRPSCNLSGLNGNWIGCIPEWRFGKPVCSFTYSVTLNSIFTGACWACGSTNSSYIRSAR